MKAFIIVGAGYGDEGKGLTTDWLVNERKKLGEICIVARCNGGTQAAHTVATPQGQRHVFKHHGSGAFLGAATYLGPHFILNPIGFREEREQCPELTRQQVYSAPDARVSLPVDMLINQCLEELRGEHKHGSCGWGIGETLERAQRMPWGTLVRSHLHCLDAARLREITAEYINVRLVGDGIYQSLSPEQKERLMCPDIMSRWLEDARYMVENTTVLPPDMLYTVADTIICEGAQGLGLDEDGEHFPHVTRSKTGSKNPLELVSASNAQLKEIFYVTRCYASRHGAGPLEREFDSHGCIVDDPTNVPNKWQDSLRVAPLDMNVVSQRVLGDLSPVLQTHPSAEVSLMVTCCDQATQNFAYYDDLGNYCTGMSEIKHPHDPNFLSGRLISQIQSKCMFTGSPEPQSGRLLQSFGPTRADVRVALRYTTPQSQRMAALLSGDTAKLLQGLVT